ncbi:hypothetical protein LCGC14_3163830, partial [marine sediment metagenome]
ISYACFIYSIYIFVFNGIIEQYISFTGVFPFYRKRKISKGASSVESLRITKIGITILAMRRGKATRTC